jgi:hypothetical protein
MIIKRFNYSMRKNPPEEKKKSGQGGAWQIKL